MPNAVATVRRHAAALAGVAVVASTAIMAVMNQDDPGPSATLGAPPLLRDDSIHLLFDSKSWDEWAARDGSPSRWEVQPDGSVLVKAGTGDAISKREFGDFQLHLEFRCPLMEGKTGQARGNSGVYLHDRYEVQVLDSWGLDSQDNDCGGIYRIAKPLVNACRPPEQWQTYDIIFRAPRFDSAGAVTEPPRVTVIHNGVVIHNNLTIPGPTGGAVGMDMAARGPIRLQDHGDPVRYRNIWVRALD